MRSRITIFAHTYHTHTALMLTCSNFADIITWGFNAFHAEGKCRRQVKNLTKFVKNVKIVKFHNYLEPQWKMHSKESKRAWYWFINSWNSRWNFRNVRKQTNFCSVKPSPAFKVFNGTVQNEHEWLSSYLFLCIAAQD